MNTERYNTLKNALIMDNNDKVLNQFVNLMTKLDREQTKKYNSEYSKYNYMSLTMEEEESRISNIVNLIKTRKEEHDGFVDDYNYITGNNPDFLKPVLYLDKLDDLEQRLKTLREYLAIKERIVNLSFNINEYKKELSNNSNNRRIQTKLNKSTKKVNDLLKLIKKEDILIMLYEFCIIDTFDAEKVDDVKLLNNILTSKIKRKKVVERELGKEETKKEEEKKVNEVVEEKAEVFPEEGIVVNQSNDDNYIKRMIPEGMMIPSQLGTVKPVTMMEKLEDAQESQQNLTIPSMGMLDTKEAVSIDSNNFVKNNQNK